MDKKAGLNYNWKCIDESTNTLCKDTQGNIILPSSSAIATYPAYTFNVNSSMQFSLLVTKYKGGLLSSSTLAYQRVKIQVASAVVPQMSMSKKKVKVNPNQDLLIQAVTIYPLSKNETYTYLWEIIEGEN